MAENEVTDFKVVVIGGSAGSLEVMLQMLMQLPEKPGAIFIVVLHRRNDKDSVLESLFSFKTKMAVKEVEDKEPIFLNTVYIAPPDYHLLVEDPLTFSLDSSERVNLSRPSIDVTFESVADIFQTRAVGVLLSGANADGARGLLTIKNAGGFTIVQNPGTAEVPYMPQQAINLFKPDVVTDGSAIVQCLLSLL